MKTNASKIEFPIQQMQRFRKTTALCTPTD